MGLIASAGGWVLGVILKMVSSKWLQGAIDFLKQSDDGRAKLAEIDSKTAIALEKENTERYIALVAAANARQSGKMNYQVFWIIICVMMFPPALILFSVAVYNIFWWEHGIWPQSWSIADFPASIKPWAQAAIDWLYDPIGTPGTVLTAGVAGRLAGGRR